MGRSPLLAGASLFILLGVLGYVALRAPRTPSVGEDDSTVAPVTPKAPEDGVCGAVDGGALVGRHFTSIVFLYDTSKSYNSGAPSSAYTTAVRRFPDLGLALAKRLPSPLRFAVNTIGGRSLGRTSLCDIYIPQRTLFRKGCSDEQLKARFDSCRERLLKVSGENDTDIVGALVYAASVLESEDDLIRGIVLFTDLVEDYGSSSADEVAPELKSTCVAAFYDFYPNDPDHPGRPRHRATEWEERLRRYGAKDVLVRHANSLTDSTLTEFLDACRGS